MLTSFIERAAGLQSQLYLVSENLLFSLSKESKNILNVWEELPTYIYIYIGFVFKLNKHMLCQKFYLISEIIKHHIEKHTHFIK